MQPIHIRKVLMIESFLEDERIIKRDLISSVVNGAEVLELGNPGMNSADADIDLETQVHQSFCLIKSVSLMIEDECVVYDRGFVGLMGEFALLETVMALFALVGLHGFESEFSSSILNR